LQPSILDQQPPRSPFPTPQTEFDPQYSPNDRQRDDLLAPPDEPARDNSSGNTLQRRIENPNTISCNELRDRAFSHPINTVSLDVSPSYGEGKSSARKNTEQQRLDFAAAAEVRDWTNYKGEPLATGRLIDLRDGRIVIDVDGNERSIPFIDLSDIDIAYVGNSWNIPDRCGTGYQTFLGRDFIASTVQWKASGLCHKPLYFEQVQLERYGHEIGPVLQPIVSSAHFFGNIAILPYKMGIHPPNECQYPVGYYRPGSCAPYMIEPFPWSLRGAAVQAAAVTGAAALIP
jgi:hypothetical protein